MAMIEIAAAYESLIQILQQIWCFYTKDIDTFFLITRSIKSNPNKTPKKIQLSSLFRIARNICGFVSKAMQSLQSIWCENTPVTFN